MSASIPPVTRYSDMARPLQKFVDRLESRSEISAEARSDLLAISPPLRTKKARWDLVRAGQKVSFACLVAEGIVARAEQFADGRRRTAATFLPGDMCDLHSLPVPIATWNITALTDCRFYEVDHADLAAVFRQHSDVAYAFWRDTVSDASILSKWVTVLGDKSARERVAHLLCEFARRAEAAGLGNRGSARFPLTQSQIAELAGTTTVHINRVVQMLEEEGAIERGRGFIELRDLGLLERIAEYDPAYLLYCGRKPRGRHRNLINKV